MQRRARYVVGLLALLVLSPAFAEAPGWVLYTHPDKLMSVRFPGKPIESEQTGKSAAGAMRVKVATFIDGDRALTATASLYPPGTRLELKTALQGSLDNLLAKLKGHIVAQKSIALDGLQGTDIQFEAPGPYKVPLRGTARVFASADPPGAYIVLAMQMDGKPDPNAQKFLASLHLGKKVESQK